MNELKIHDIKELSSIPDYSFFIFLALLVVLGIVLVLVIFLIYKLFKNRNKNLRKSYFKILKEVDLTNSKKASYTITKYSRLISRNEREKRLCEELIDELEKYKYKKEVSELSSDSIIIFERFMDSLDV